MAIVGTRAKNFVGGVIEKVTRRQNSPHGNPAYEFILEGRKYKSEPDCNWTFAVTPSRWEGKEAIFYVNTKRKIVGVESTEIDL